MKATTKKFYNEELINEIINMIKTNINIYYNANDEYFPKLKENCKENINNKYKPLPYNELLYYVEEVLADLINTPYLYDFRSLE